MTTGLPLAYRQNPRPVGFEVSYRLAGGVLVVDTSLKRTDIPLASVAQVRLTYEPRSMAKGIYQAKLRLKDGTTLKLSSVSWKGMMDLRRQDPEYSAFVQALLSGVAAANPNARLLAGKPQLQWAAMAAVAALALVGAALFVWEALRSGAHGSALLGAAIAAVGIWQLEPMVRLNRPRAFTPPEMPSALLP